MNAYEQLCGIKERLELNGASEDSITLVEKFIKRAEPERHSSQAVPQALMLRHLIRQREALDNMAIYNDIQELISEIESRRAQVDEDAVRPAYEDNRPKPKSYYKTLKKDSQ